MTNITAKRFLPVARYLLTAALVAALAGCGGSGGSGGGGGGGGGNSNKQSRTNANGTTTIEVKKLELNAGDSEDSFTRFTLTVKTASGAPYVNTRVVFTTGAGLLVVEPEGGEGRTDANGVIEGTIQGVGGGAFQLQAQPIVNPLDPSSNPPIVTINLLVFGSPAATATPTSGNGPTNGPAPTVTPTVVPVVDVATLVVQVNPFVVRSGVQTVVQVTVLAFDQNNLGVAGVRLLLDSDPRGGNTFANLTPITNSGGIAQTTLTISEGAAVGDIEVTASANDVTDSTTIDVVSGMSDRPVATVVLETDQPIIGTDSGGTASLKAHVFDADNNGLPNVNVLFSTEIGQVSPPVDVTCGAPTKPCPPADTGLAQSTLTVPPGAVVREYRLSANAGGITGGATINIVAGRGGTGTGNPNAAPGEPASITLGASPTALVTSGAGGTEQATIIARVFDNNNNPLSAHVVALRVVPDVPNGPRMLPLSGVQPPAPTKCMEDPARQAAQAAGRLALGVSDRAGFVLASLKAGTIKGTVAVEACADSQNNDESVSAVVSLQSVATVGAGPPALLTLVMNPRFVDNNDGTLMTTVAALVKDVNGNTVEDNTSVTFAVQNRQDVNIVGSATTNNLPNCDVDQFPAQTGLPVTAQPGSAISCIFYPSAQQGTVVKLLAQSSDVSNEDNTVEDENFSLPPGSVTGPANELPSARNFSLASQFLNMSGRIRFGLQSVITAFVGDRFGNPVKRTTTVHFVTDGGGVTSQGLTNLTGRATAILTTQGNIPEDGLVTVTATTQGEEDFFDTNGDGEFEEGVDIFDPTIHDQDNNGVWSANTTISTQIRVLFTGNTLIDVEPRSFTLNPGEVQCFDVFVSDAGGNPLVGGSTVTAGVTDGLSLLGAGVQTVGDTNLSCSEAPGNCTFSYCVFQSQTLTDPKTGGVTFSVASSDLGGGGNGGGSVSSVGTLLPAAPPEP